MSPNNVSLTSGMRSSLFHLQQTSRVMATAQQRLATGKQVHAAIDDPIRFFTALIHSQRAQDLTALKDQMSEAIKTLQAADNGIAAITTLIESAKSLAQEALATGSATERTAFGARFNEVMSQIDTLTGDAGYRGTNLLAGDGSGLEVGFNENGDSNVSVAAFDATHSGLGVRKLAVVTRTGQTGVQSDILHNGNPTAWVGTVDFDSPYDENDLTGEAPTNDYRDHALNYVLDAAGMDSLDVWYNFHTREYSNDLDRFEILINGEVELSVRSGDYGDDDSATVESSGWRLFSYDLADYAGPTMDLTIYAGNTGDSIVQSWAYVDIQSTGAAINTWAASGDIETSLGQLDGALSVLRTQSKSLSTSLNTITTRQDFTSALVNILSDGAAQLTMADLNEEGANMLMLQTRQMLTINSLGLASQAGQSVLRLF